MQDAISALGAREPELGPALRSALAVVAGTQVERTHPLSPDDEIALLIPVAGGAPTTRRQGAL